MMTKRRAWKRSDVTYPRGIHVVLTVVSAIN
jgi:alpha-D-ribose 1-methylphosphonate 5-triphosphate synthase subunit PhnH